MVVKELIDQVRGDEVRGRLHTRSCDTGFFMEPTILADVEDHMMAAEEESFGPVMVVSPFETGYSDVMNQLFLMLYIL